MVISTAFIVLPFLAPNYSRSPSAKIYAKISEKVKEDTGKLDNDKIFLLWNEWVRREAKKYSKKNTANK